jgi:hypothetical protein
MRRLSHLSVLGVLIVFGTAEKVTAGTVIELTSGPGTFTTTQSFFWGQSFLTPSVINGWNNITFNFFTAPGTPASFGTAYIFTAPYTGIVGVTGPPATGLAASGYLAKSTGIVGGKEVFAPSLVLLPGTMYYLYEDAPNPSGTNYTGGSNQVGATSVLSTGTSSSFNTSAGAHSLNFNVSGDAVEVPELDAGSAISALSALAMGVVMLNTRRRAWKQAA